MKNALLLLVLLVAAQSTVLGEEQFISPDMRFEAYTTGAAGDRLYLRANGAPGRGFLVASTVSGVPITAQWSPDSRFLAVIHDFFDNPPAIYEVFPDPLDRRNGVTNKTAYISRKTLVKRGSFRWQVVEWNIGNRKAVIECSTDSGTTRFTAPLITGP